MSEPIVKLIGSNPLISMFVVVDELIFEFLGDQERLFAEVLL
jgi:hypothetical protein